MHWSVSEGAIEIDEDYKENHEALREEIDSYKNKISTMKAEDPSAFDRKMAVKAEVEKAGTNWKQLQGAKQTIGPFHGKRDKFNVDYIFDMYKAAQKDKRKQELKDKFFGNDTDRQ